MIKSYVKTHQSLTEEHAEEIMEHLVAKRPSLVSLSATLFTFFSNVLVSGYLVIVDKSPWTLRENIIYQD